MLFIFKLLQQKKLRSKTIHKFGVRCTNNSVLLVFPSTEDHSKIVQVRTIMSKPIVLYYTLGSPPCHAVMMLAKAINLQLDLIEVNLLAGEQMEEEFTKINPQHTVPTIVDNGFVLWDSHAIMTYLVDKFARSDSLYPKDLARRAKVNQLLFFDHQLFENFRYFYSAPLFYGKPADPYRLEKAVKSLDIMEQDLSGKGYVAGSEMTIADISLIVNLSAFEMGGHDFNTHPNVAKWMLKCKKEVPGYNAINQKGLDLMKQVVTQRKIDLGL